MLISPIIGAITDRVGHGKVMATGILLMGASIAAFGAAKYIDSNSVVIAVAIFLRVC